MKANEFIKEYGLFTFWKSTEFLNSRKYLVVYTDEIDFTDEITPRHGKLVFDRKEVKRLVKSHEIVERLGGLEKAKRTCSIDLERLQQAIADVESCQ